MGSRCPPSLFTPSPSHPSPPLALLPHGIPQAQQLVSALFDLPPLKAFEAQLAPVRSYFEAHPVYLASLLSSLLVLPLALLLTRSFGGKVRAGGQGLVSGPTRGLRFRARS